MITIPVMIVVASATPAHILQLFMTPVCLPAVFTVTLDGITQSLFRFVDLSPAAVVIAICMSRNRPSH